MKASTIKSKTRATKPSSKKGLQPASAIKRSYLKQSDVPNASLAEALRIPEAIFEHYAGKATSPFNVAKALNVDPGGSQLRVLSGASIAFGLIDGGAQAASISVTGLASRIIRPKAEGEEMGARREAVLTPRVFGEFLHRYDGHAFPRQDLALNVLEEMGVPRGKVQEVLERIESSAASVGFIETIKGRPFVHLSKPSATLDQTDLGHEEDQNDEPSTHLLGDSAPLSNEALPSHENEAALSRAVKEPDLTAAIADDHRRRKVFVTHGKNRDMLEPIKRLLEYGELEAVISVERQSVSKPVPEKFMDDMRKAGAAIIHVDAERTIKDTEGNEHVFLNPNVLIEIGAAMAFYGRRFILLVREGVKLPSNLQGLFEVRYAGEVLDAAATIKNHDLPRRDRS